MRLALAVLAAIAAAAITIPDTRPAEAAGGGFSSRCSPIGLGQQRFDFAPESTTSTTFVPTSPHGPSFTPRGKCVVLTFSAETVVPAGEVMEVQIGNLIPGVEAAWPTTVRWVTGPYDGVLSYTFRLDNLDTTALHEPLVLFRSVLGQQVTVKNRLITVEH
jgi:hypothetical protein